MINESRLKNLCEMHDRLEDLMLGGV